MFEQTLSQNEMIGKLIKQADYALQATVLFVLALGLYSLFVDDRIPMPSWLSDGDLGQLKELLAGVVVVAIAVIFLGQALTWDGTATCSRPGSLQRPSSRRWRSSCGRRRGSGTWTRRTGASSTRSSGAANRLAKPRTRRSDRRSRPGGRPRRCAETNVLGWLRRLVQLLLHLAAHPGLLAQVLDHEGDHGDQVELAEDGLQHGGHAPDVGRRGQVAVAGGGDGHEAEVEVVHRLGVLRTSVSCAKNCSPLTSAMSPYGVAKNMAMSM